jgi:hypothetical protein
MKSIKKQLDNEPAARKYKLRPPRGMLLMGPPGTDNSRFAIGDRELFEYEAHEFDELGVT